MHVNIFVLVSIAAHTAAHIDTVVIFQSALTCILWGYRINFTIACQRYNNIIKFMVIIAAGSSLISGQKRVIPFQLPNNS